MRKNIINSVEEISEGVKEFINDYKKELRVHDGDITIDCARLLEIFPKGYDSLLENPESIIPTISLEIQNSFVLEEPKKIRFFNLHGRKKISQIHAGDIGKFCSLRGVIKRITKIIPRVRRIKYECSSCGTIITIEQDKKAIKEPARCSCGRKGNFRKVGEEVVDIQEINLEETQDELDGRQPQQIRVYLEGSLVDKTLSSRLQPGKKVEIVGVINKLPAFMTQKDEEQNVSEFMINANNVISLEQDDDVTLSEEDITQIKEIAATEPLKKLAESLVPEVYGNPEVKEAIVLQLVKGVPKEKSDGSFSREDIHILLCGDPGVAKSVSVQSAVMKTPRAQMLIGTKTSRVGLGAMVVKDELLQTWGLQVGALVLANGGLLGIDELDKMNKENLSELLEPMSSGTVSINKAGISAKMNARTSILASANPIQGNFDLSQPLAKQLDLPSPILNRFDLIFIMLDKPNKEFDTKVIEHVFNSLLEKREPEIPNSLFKKYISYCRKLKPKLQPEVLESLKSFYTNLRQRSSASETRYLPINVRNMEGLIRLAEASAKIRLSDKVEKQDFDISKRIFMFCLKQIGIDNETGMVDMSRLTEKFPVSKRGKMESILEIIHYLTDRFGRAIPYEEIIRKAEERQISKFDVGITLEQLQREAMIIEPRQGVYSLV